MKINIILPKTNYQPNELIKGQCEWDTMSIKKPKSIRLILKVWNEGKVGRTEAIAKELQFTPNASTGTLDFQMVMPKYPLSYYGNKFSVKWGIQAELNDKVSHLVEIISGSVKRRDNSDDQEDESDKRLG